MNLELFKFIADTKIEVANLSEEYVENGASYKHILKNGDKICYVGLSYHDYIRKSKPGDPIFIGYGSNIDLILLCILSFLEKSIDTNKYLLSSSYIDDVVAIFMDKKVLVLSYMMYNFLYNNKPSLFNNSYLIYVMKEEKLKKISDELSRVKVETEFNLIKVPEGDVLISCSDLDHDPVDNFVDNVSFCRSTYSIDKDDMKVHHVMSEVDVEYHGVDVRKVYKVLEDQLDSLKPYVAYMTINGEDVDPKEYLEFNSLSIIWD